MLLKITGDGTFGNTRIETEDGTLIEGVTDLKIRFLKHSDLPVVTLKIRRIHFDMAIKKFEIEREGTLKHHLDRLKMRFTLWQYLWLIKVINPIRQKYNLYKAKRLHRL